MARIKIITALLALIACGCSDADRDLDSPLALFHELKFQEALPLFEQAAEKHPQDADIVTWLAETYRRLGRQVEAESAARAALAIDSCHSLAHFVMADILIPSPYETDVPDTHPNWQHLMRAIECDSANGNAWMMIMVASIWRGKEQMAERAQRRLAESGFLTPAALAFGRWLLSTLPENAILFTNGDMDTYPTMALQKAENLRPDVTIIEREWLNFQWGRRWYREQEDLSFPASEERLGASVADPAIEILHGWSAQMARGTFGRPIAFAVTVNASFYQTLTPRLRYAGPFYLLYPEPVAEVNDLDALLSSLEGIRPNDFKGPWVSEWDISPIRGKYARYGAANITESALVLTGALIGDGRSDEAVQWLNWAKAFENGTELGPFHTERFRELRESIN